MNDKGRWLSEAFAQIGEQFPNVDGQWRQEALRQVRKVEATFNGLDTLSLLAAGSNDPVVKGYMTNVLVACLRACAVELGAHARIIRNQPNASCPDAATDIVTDFNRTQREPRPNRGGQQ